MSTSWGRAPAAARIGAGVSTAFVMIKRYLSSASAVDVQQSVDGGVARGQKVGLSAG